MRTSSEFSKIVSNTQLFRGFISRMTDSLVVKLDNLGRKVTKPKLAHLARLTRACDQDRYVPFSSDEAS